MLRCLCARSVAVVQTPLQHTIFGPPVHSHINGVPTGETLRKPSPLAALFRHIQNRVQHLQVGQTYVSALNGQAIFDTGVLRFRDFHPTNICLVGGICGWKGRFSVDAGAETDRAFCVSSGKFVGDLTTSARMLAQKPVKLPAGGIERALLHLF